MPITMPGVAVKNVDIEGMIKKLLKVKQVPIKRIEKEIDQLALQQEVWKTLQERLRKLQNAAKAMFDYTNPFQEMIAKSSLKESFTGKAGRTAKKGRRRIRVLQLATAHRIASAPVDREKVLKHSRFTLTVGEKTMKVDFSDGGDIRELATALERDARELVNVVLTWDTAQTAILVLEALQSGAGMEIKFGGNLATLNQIKLVTKYAGSPATGKDGTKPDAKPDGPFLKLPLDKQDAFTPWSAGDTTYKSDILLKEGVLTVKPESRVEQALSKPLTVGEELELQLEVRFDLLSAPSNTAASNQPATNKAATNAQPKGSDYDPQKIKLGPTDPVKVGDIKIYGSNLIPDEKGKKKPKQTPKKPDTKQPDSSKKPAPALSSRKVLALIEGIGTARKQTILSSSAAPGTWTPMTVPIDSLSGFSKVTRLAFINDNSGATVSFRNVKVVSKKKKQPPTDKKQPDRKLKKGDTIAKNNLQRPRDAQLLIDGIKVKRKTNKIEDLIDGVTLNLHAPGKEGILTIDHDYDTVKKYIYNLVETYNKTLIYVNSISRHLSREDREKLKKELENKSDLAKALEDKNKALVEKHTGKLSGDLTVARLRSRMGVIMMSAYPTRLNRALTLLVQLGISTGKVGASWSDLKTSRGTLELDTAKLDKMIDKDMVAVAQLFGWDRNGDGSKNKVDPGLGIRLHYFLKVYTQPGNSGIIAVKLKYLARLIRDKNRSKVRVERSLKAYEEKLRRKFTGMETRVKQYRSQGRWLENQNRNRNQQ